MASVGRIKLKVHLNDDDKVSEVFVSATTKCRDIVHRLQRQIHQRDCCLVEVWQGCERLVPEEELIQSTLLEWDTDLDDVAFYLRPNEDLLTIMPPSGLTDGIPVIEDIDATVFGDQSNGSQDGSHSSLSDEVLLGSGQFSIEELQQIILRQQQEISLKEEELSTKEEQLRDVKQRARNKIQSSYITQLEAQVQEQDESMQQLRDLLNETEDIRLINEALVNELVQIEAQFTSKEQELAMAVAKVDGMTQQLEEQQQGWRRASAAHDKKKTSKSLKEMDMLRQELMMRNELNHQQSIQLQVQKKLLAEKQKELSDLDAHVESLNKELRYKKAHGNQVNKLHSNNSNVSIDLEEDLWDDTDGGNDGEDVDICSSNNHHHNSRVLETLVEEEEPSVANLSHSSTSSSSGSIMSSPRVSSPGRASRVSKLATFFEVAAQNVENGNRTTNNGSDEPAISLTERQNESLNYLSSDNDNGVKDFKKVVTSLDRLRPISVSQLDDQTHGADKVKSSSPLSSPSSLSSLSSFSSNSSLTPSPGSSSYPDRKAEDLRTDRPRPSSAPSARTTRLDRDECDAPSSPEIRKFPSPLHNLRSAAMSNRMIETTSDTQDGSSSRPSSAPSVISANNTSLVSPKMVVSSAKVSLSRGDNVDAKNIPHETLISPLAQRGATGMCYHDDTGSESSVSSQSSLSGSVSEKSLTPRKTSSRVQAESVSTTSIVSSRGQHTSAPSMGLTSFSLSKRPTNTRTSARESARTDISTLQDSSLSDKSKNREDDTEKKKTRRVILDPHAVLLDAAMEGELEQVRHVIKDVEDPSLANSDGITALHNSVCGNHFLVVQFLVEYGCDINLPDSHGWTPLHCSAVNNNLNVVRYLIKRGACIFAATNLEKKIPADCCDKNAPGYFACFKYLQEITRDFGLLNDGKVYALYAYTASEKDELSFDCGEELTVLRRGDTTEKEWWWAKNSEDGTGYIPRNLLGISPRVAPEV